MSRTGRRRSLWVGVLAGIALLYATAVPSSAAPTGTKYYTYTVTPGTVTAGTQGQVFQVTVKNTSPKSSSSNISSVSITVPSQFAIVGTPTIDASSTNPNASATVTIGSGGTFCSQGTSQTVNVCSLDPIKRQQTVTVDITTNVTSSNLTCGNGNTSDPWQVLANTGSQLNGNAFDTDPAQTPVTTTIGYTCPLSFSPKTPNGTIGSTSADGVTATVQTTPATSGVNVTLTVTKPSGATVTIDGTTGTSATKSTGSDGSVSFKVQGDTAGGYGLSASASFFSSANDSFTLFEYGDLACGDSLSQEGITGERGTYDKNGAPCTNVDYSIFKDNIVNGQFGITWDTSADPYAALKYQPPWQPEQFPSSGQLSQLQTAWYRDNNGNLVWHVATVCSSDQLPAPYTTLAADVASGDTTIQVTSASGLPNAPFAIVIGTERMWVTSVSGTTLTLGDSSDAGSAVRGDGGTTVATHTSGDLVMSTPLTIDPNQKLADGTTTNPEFGKVVPVCIANDGWAPAGYDNNGNLLIQRTTEVIDIGDSFTRK